MTPSEVTLEQALPLLEERAARGGGRKTARRAPAQRAGTPSPAKPKAPARKKAAAAAAAPKPKKTASDQ
jgi:DNA topoisomerase-1